MPRIIGSFTTERSLIGKVKSCNPDTHEVEVYVPKLMPIISENQANRSIRTDYGKNVAEGIKYSNNIINASGIIARARHMDASMPMPGSLVELEFFSANPNILLWKKFNPDNSFEAIEQDRFPAQFKLKIGGKEITIHKDDYVEIEIPDNCVSFLLENNDETKYRHFKIAQNDTYREEIENIKTNIGNHEYVETIEASDGEIFERKHQGTGILSKLDNLEFRLEEIEWAEPLVQFNKDIQGIFDAAKIQEFLDGTEDLSLFIKEKTIRKNITYYTKEKITPYIEFSGIIDPTTRYFILDNETGQYSEILSSAVQNIILQDIPVYIENPDPDFKYVQYTGQFDPSIDTYYYSPDIYSYTPYIVTNELDFDISKVYYTQYGYREVFIKDFSNTEFQYFRKVLNDSDPENVYDEYIAIDFDNNEFDPNEQYYMANYIENTEDFVEGRTYYTRSEVENKLVPYKGDYRLDIQYFIEDSETQQFVPAEFFYDPETDYYYNPLRDDLMGIIARYDEIPFSQRRKVNNEVFTLLKEVSDFYLESQMKATPTVVEEE